ncbi:MAG TPA: polysaccharide deacetylase family protein [Clostridiaceae bacterium]
MKKIKKYKLCLIVLFIFTFVFSIHLFDTEVMARKDSNEKIKVYLTFDDGPTFVTEKILNILKEKNIKATFFIVGNKIEGKEEILKHIYQDGHSIGLHSYTHRYKRIYEDQDSFMAEMNETSDAIIRILNIKTDIIRFPGGSNPYLNDLFLERLHENHYKIFDWNVTVSDGLDPNKSPRALFKEAIKAKSSLSRIILLLHCSADNINTSKALPEIIKYYDKEPYEFSKITEETKEYYFRYKNKKNH